MTPALVGLLIGAVVGFVNFAVLRALAKRVAMPETVKLLNVVGVADLVLLPVVGYLIGAYAWG